MRVDSLFNQAKKMVEGLYSYAMDERGFRPEQAFAYVQDEVENLMKADAPSSNAILQTAIYVEGNRLGLELSKESPYATDMLDVLADAYSKCAVEDLIEIGVDEAELREIQSDMELVRNIFLK